jgi:hypothetical protein
MVVGDIISSTFASGTQTFQPSAGTEIMITFAGGGIPSYTSYTASGGSQIGITDGTNASLFYQAYIEARNYAPATQYNTYASTNFSGGNLKIGITNTFYLTMIAQGNASYSGIQIK